MSCCYCSFGFFSVEKKAKRKEAAEVKTGRKKLQREPAEKMEEGEQKTKESLSSGGGGGGKGAGRPRAWKPSFKDPRRAGQLVAEVLEPRGEYLCLGCRAAFLSYRELKRHAALAGCAAGRRCSIVPAPLQKEEVDGIEQRYQAESKYTPELSGYVTG